MNLQDILKYDKGYQLQQKINNYGRKIIEAPDGRDVYQSNIVDYSDIREITDFKILEKGCETWLKGSEFPMRICLQEDRPAVLHQTKRIIPTILRTFKKWKIISVIYFLINWEEYLNFTHYALIDVFYPEPKFYSQPVREIYRVVRQEKIRDILCAILEFDNSYRFRFQDIIGELNKDLFEDNPIKELKRLFKIWSSREDGLIEVKNLTVIPKLLFLLKLTPKIIKELKSIVKNINLEEIKLSIEDIYWCKNIKFSYGFNFREEEKIKNLVEQLKDKIK